jgi:hypothetical protein
VAPVLHMLRSLAESSRADHMMEILSYVLSFGSFVIFVWVARCAVASPTFRPESGRLSRLVFACVSERPGAGYESRKKEKPEHSADARPDSFARDAARLATCTLGIQVSYLMWGLMQERIMTRPYSTGELFRSSKFLVFANRFLALLVACARPAEHAVLAVLQLTLASWAALRTQDEPPSRSGPNARPNGRLGCPCRRFCSVQRAGMPVCWRAGGSTVRRRRSTTHRCTSSPSPPSPTSSRASVSTRHSSTSHSRRRSWPSRARWIVTDPLSHFIRNHCLTYSPTKLLTYSPTNVPGRGQVVQDGAGHAHGLPRLGQAVHRARVRDGPRHHLWRGHLQAQRSTLASYGARELRS